jgi:chromosome segregation ATPase
MPLPLTDHDLHLLEIAAERLPVPETERFRWQDLVRAHREALRDLDDGQAAVGQAEATISDLEDDVASLKEELAEARSEARGLLAELSALRMSTAAWSAE